MSNRHKQFIADNTVVMSPPLVPEVRLHLAEESLPIWRKTEEELGEIDVAPPFWAFAWAGGQALARYLLDNPQIISGRTVLDIGSGSGLVAIAAAVAGARSVIANDTDAFAVAAMHMNAALNGVSLEVDNRDLLAAGFVGGAAEVICLADVFYERALGAAALRFLDAAQSANRVVLAGDPQRSYFPAERFNVIARYAVPVTRELEDSEIKRAAVWALKPR